MTDSKKLLTDNLAQIAKMAPEAAASAVESLLDCIERNSGPGVTARIRLKNPSGRRIEYELLDGGTPSLVGRCGRSLGLVVTDTTIEAPGK